MHMSKKVALIMGSDSDFAVMKAAVKMLADFGVETTVRVISAHRTPEQAMSFAKNARQDGYGVIIAAAGKAAHLGGVLAGNSTLPVIGVPISAKTLDGLDALLATVQMPPGVPVATVAIDGAVNAALLAVQILSVSDAQLAEKFAQYKETMKEKVQLKDQQIQREAAQL